jgi:hypothetical protein
VNARVPAPGPIDPPVDLLDHRAMPFETGKAQIDEVLRQIRNGERRPLPAPPPDPMREMMETAARIGDRWGRSLHGKRTGR